MKKYKLDLTEYIFFKGWKLYRVVALRDIPEHGVNAGDKGGWVAWKTNSKKDILSQQGSCWVGGDAKVFGEVLVSDDALITDNAVVQGLGIISCISTSMFGQNDTIFIRGNAVIDGERYIGFINDEMNDRIKNKFLNSYWKRVIV